MKKIILFYIFFTFAISQTGIITPDKFYGLGIWAKSNRPFNGDVDIFYDFKTEFYIPAGIELSVGALKFERDDIFYSAAIGYHYKFRNMGVKLGAERQMYDLNENKDLYTENFDLTFYKTGKLNPFISFINDNTIGDSINDNKTLDFVNVGGMGRITRHITFTTSIMLPILKNKILIEHAWIEFAFGYELGSAIGEIFTKPIKSKK